VDVINAEMGMLEQVSGLGIDLERINVIEEVRVEATAHDKV
jgi:hypothetical protein